MNRLLIVISFVPWQDIFIMNSETASAYIWTNTPKNSRKVYLHLNQEETKHGTKAG